MLAAELCRQIANIDLFDDMTSPRDRALPPSMERQMARGSRLRRLEERIGRLRYRSALSAGGVFGLTVALMSLLGNWLPALQPSRPIGVRWGIISIALYVAWGMVLALAATGLLRAWTRWRARALRRRAI